MCKTIEHSIELDESLIEKKKSSHSVEILTGAVCFGRNDLRGRTTSCLIESDQIEVIPSAT